MGSSNIEETEVRAASRSGGRIVVGMSGGVDSSVAAAILVEWGHEVIGVTLRVWPWQASEDPVGHFGSCCSFEATDGARQVARRLGIPHYLLNSEDEFARAVIGPFADAYRLGRTPVPCVSCNKDLKFGSLLRRARAWDAEAVGTGHYARITRDGASGRYLLWRGRDAHKDQSDFLWPLSQEQLAAARFPVGDLTKDEVRDHARRLGLATAEAPESQELCFVPDRDYRGFLRRTRPEVFEAGPIVDDEGRVIGTHAGVANFTVGQRRGLGLATSDPLYVTDLDSDARTVRVGPATRVERTTLLAGSLNFIASAPPESPVTVRAKIRHNHEPALATVRMVERDTAEVVFAEPQRAITPGQSVVWYQGDCVLGGGVIQRSTDAPGGR